ncbi:MAG: hypothetical protein ACKVP0_28360, partial [Pirellulaceae bacterium]
MNRSPHTSLTRKRRTALPAGNRLVAKTASTRWPSFPSLALQAGVVLSSLLATASAQELNTPFVSWEKPTQRLQNATVTVRILSQPKQQAEKIESANPDTAEKSAADKSKDLVPSTVIVC